MTIGGFHLFALIPTEAAYAATLPPGLENGQVMLLPAGDLAAVAQPVSGGFLSRLQEGGAGEAERAWLTERLLDHERVVETFAGSGPAYPLGFGVLLTDPAILKTAIAPHVGDLEAFFARTRGRQEWSLKFHLRSEAPRRGDVARSARSGADYLAARRAIPAQRAELETRAREIVDAAIARIRPLCQAMIARDAGAAPEAGLSLLANLALLADADAEQTLVAAVDILVQDANSAGIDITFTGPWPPYSFRPKITLATRN